MLSGRAASIADSGALLIAHIVFQLIDADGMDEPDPEWESALETVGAHVDSVLKQLIPLVNKLFGDGSCVTTTFSSEDRCERLVTATLCAVEEGTDAPDLEHYQSRAPRSRQAAPTSSH